MPKTTIYHNGRIATNAKPYFVDTMVVCDGKVASIGRAADLMEEGGHDCEMVDLGGRTVIPGLNDSHLACDPGRASLQSRTPLGWGVPSLADAMRMLKEQALRTPAPQWVRGRRWLDRVPVCRTADAHARRDQRSGTGHAGLCAAPLRPRHAERGGPCARSATRKTRRTPSAEKFSATVTATRLEC